MRTGAFIYRTVRNLKNSVQCSGIIVLHQGVTLLTSSVQDVLNARSCIIATQYSL